MGQSQQFEVDSILEHIGDFGRYQKFIYLLLCIPSVAAGVAIISSTFATADVYHRCFIPECDAQDASTLRPPWINWTIPVENKDSTWPYSNCLRYEHKGNASCDSSDDFNTNQTQSCSGWVYDQSEFPHTVVSEFDLTCENAWKTPLSVSAYMAGMMVAVVLFGFISDRFGRKFCLSVSVVIMALTGIASGLAPNYWSYTLNRFLTAMGGAGAYESSFIIAMELVGIEKRMFCGTMINFSFAMGELLVVGIAYFVRDWRTLLIVTNAPIFLLVAYWWLVPESVRWLITQRRYSDAEKILVKAAARNGKIFPRHLLPDIAPTSVSNLTSENVSESSEEVRKESAFDLLRTPNMRKRSLILFYNWMVTTIAYYGLSLNASHLGSNIFASNALTMLVELPATLLCALVLYRYGRRQVLTSAQFFSGIACLAVGLLPEEYIWGRVGLSLIGKFLISGAFAVNYVYAAEIMPTSIRNVGVGCCSMFARIGGIVAPFVTGLNMVSPSLPYIIFGFSGMSAGFLGTFLPETLGVPLPQTVNEAEMFVGPSAWVYLASRMKRCFKEKEKDTEEYNKY